MAEPGVPHQLEGQILGGVAEDTAVKLPDLKNQVLYQFLKLSVGGLILGLMGVIPRSIVMDAQIGQIV